MNKTLIVAAISALTAGAAFAQSSVVLYGRFNVGAEQVETKNAAGVTTKVKALDDNASRWGLKGTEDLGGGLRAGFQLESGFDATTGTAKSAFWGRQSEVNLGGAFGTIRAGRFTSEAYYAIADYVSMHNHDTGLSEDELYAYVIRPTNKIAYRAPTFVKNLSLEVSVGAPEGASPYRDYDAAVNYSIGALALGGAYLKDGPNKAGAVRALYDGGSFLFGGYVQRQDDLFFGTRNIFRLSGAYIVGGSEFHLNAGRASSFSKVSGSESKQYTVAYNYNLSKRTKVFAYYTKLLDPKFVDNNGFGSRAPGEAFNNGIGDRTGISAGIRHNF